MNLRENKEHQYLNAFKMPKNTTTGSVAAPLLGGKLRCLDAYRQSNIAQNFAIILRIIKSSGNQVTKPHLLQQKWSTFSRVLRKRNTLTHARDYFNRSFCHLVVTSCCNVLYSVDTVLTIYPLVSGLFHA